MKKKAAITLLPYLMVISFIGIFAFSLAPLDEKGIKYLGIFLSGFIPILVYHYFLKQQQFSKFGAVHLSDSEVDSIYYFGFVVTLLTLIASVLTLGVSGNQNIDLQTIGIQFGLGLFVTGYALVARLHLQVSNESNIEPEDAYANYVDRVNGLLGRVDLAYSDLDQLLQKIVDRLRATLEAESAENATRLARQIESSFSPILDACKTLGERIGGQGLGNEIESMRAVVAATNKTFKHFETRLQTFSQEADKSIEPITNLGIALLACENGGIALSKVLTELKIDPNIAKTLSESIDNINLTFNSFSAAVKKLESELASSSNNSTETFKKFNVDLSESTKLLTSSMGQLEVSLQTFSQEAGKSIEPITNLGAALLACENGSKSLSKVFTDLKIDPSITKTFNDSIDTIGLGFKSFSNAVQKLENEFGNSSSKSIESFSQFNAGLLESTQLLSKSMSQLAEAMAGTSVTLTNSLREMTSNETEK